ncbi:(d)CMP kinase [Vibrio fluvialis]|nr:(d)CMP kinase [Vibrio fluvialis]
MDAQLFREIEALNQGALILIEGFSGSGKTSLAQRLSKKLNIQYIDTDCYVKRQSDTDYYVTLLDIEHLKEVVGSFVKRNKSLIYVGICAQESLAKLGFSPSYCSGQLKLATVLEFSQYSRSDSLGVRPPLY